MYGESGMASEHDKDIGVMLKFLDMREGPDGKPVRDRLGQPRPEEGGWTSLAWNEFTECERVRLEKQGWRRAFHGFKVQSL